MPRLSSLDAWLLVALIGLVGIGLMANYSTSFSEGEMEFTHFYRQLLWGSLGLVLMLLFALVPTKFFQSFAYVGYVLGILALMAVLIVGASRMGARRWIDLGPFQFQASEFAKLTTLLGLARFLSDRPRDIGKPWVTLVAIGMALLPSALIFVEPDLGTSTVFPMMLFCVLAWAGIPLWHLLLLIAPVAAVLTSWHHMLFWMAFAVFGAAVLALRRRLGPILVTLAVFLVMGEATPKLWNKLEPYQQKRLLTFIDPEADRLGSAYQLVQSKIAVGSGALTGKGFLNGTQTQLKFLPEGHTDFIFSAWAEEFGFVGAILIVVLFFVVFYRGLRLAARCHNPFYSMVATGIVAMITVQALTNLLMTVGYLPVTGVPLPLISYGGSSLLTWMMLGGLLIGISLRWREH